MERAGDLGCSVYVGDDLFSNGLSSQGLGADEHSPAPKVVRARLRPTDGGTDPHDSRND